VWATAPQFCGLKILRDGIHGCAESPLFGSGTRRSRRRGSRRPLGRGAIRLQQHLPREPLMVLFQTAKLRRGVQMFRATRSSAHDRQITTTLRQVLSSERPINHQRGARCQRQIGAAVKGLRKSRNGRTSDSEKRVNRIDESAAPRTRARIFSGVKQLTQGSRTANYIFTVSVPRRPGSRRPLPRPDRNVDRALGRRISVSDRRVRIVRAEASAEPRTA
jgi:hypothetical protein